MKALKEKAVFIVPNGTTAEGDADGAVPIQGVVAAAALQAMARDAFLPSLSQDGFVNGKPVTLVTVWSAHENRTLFNYFVNDAIAQVGVAAQLPEVLVEVNGVLGIYTQGEDYL